MIDIGKASVFQALAQEAALLIKDDSLRNILEKVSVTPRRVNAPYYGHYAIVARDEKPTLCITFPELYSDSPNAKVHLFLNQKGEFRCSRAGRPEMSFEESSTYAQKALAGLQHLREVLL